MHDQNSIVIDKPAASGNTIVYHYKVTGVWAEAFDLNQSFEVKYDVDVTAVPIGIAIIPLLANILPMAWVYDAVVEVPACDANFLACLPEVKRGYEDMYPMVRLGGELKVGDVEENRRSAKGAICLFSGGVDAFCTLIRHVDEHPTLLTMRGADVKLSDVEGWSLVRTHCRDVADDFSVEFHEVASTFRTFLREDVLDKRVSVSGDGWWHGFQHGLGILSHAAPLAWLLGKSVVYIASSFTAAEKGEYTCASDPTIDNHVRFCGTRVAHDGYELSRQDKVRSIVTYSHSTGVPIKLRVCWESEGGSNCCHCEKCLRTILAIYAEGADPREFGFDYSDIGRLAKSYRHRFSLLGSDSRMLQRYFPIQKAMRDNRQVDEIPGGLRWFYDGDLPKLVHSSVPKRVVSKLARKAKSLLS